MVRRVLCGVSLYFTWTRFTRAKWKVEVLRHRASDDHVPALFLFRNRQCSKVRSQVDIALPRSLNGLNTTKTNCNSLRRYAMSLSLE